MQDHHDDGHDEQNVNEAAREVKGEEPTEPKEEENNSDDCEHAIDSAFLLCTVAHEAENA